MSDVRYVRGPTVVWRDTGEYVVALPVGGHKPMMLGGGGRQLWGMLHTARSLPELVAAFTASGEPPTEGDIATTLEQLVSLQLVQAQRGD